MRVRLLPFGDTAEDAIQHFDRFPAEIKFGSCDAGNPYADPSGRSLCQLETESGHVLLRGPEGDEGEQVFVNDLPLIYGPLNPGDRLRLADREFIVSFERVTTSLPPAAVNRICRDREQIASPGETATIPETNSG